MAIPMPIVQDIRRLDRQGLSRAQIARRLHVDRGDRLDSPAAEVLTAPATHAPPWSCPRRLLPHWEHRIMPLRGRTRISSTGSEHSGESVIRTSSATMPLTFGNPANKLLLRRSSRFISLAGKQNTREHPSRSRNQRLDDELTSTKTAIAPLCILCKAVISFLMRFLRW